MSTSSPFPRTRPPLFVSLGCAAALLIASSCGGTPPATSAPTPSTPTPSSSAAAAASSSPAASAASAPTGHVTGMSVAQKADHYTRVMISFENPTAKTCKITGYTLSWDRGSKDIPLDDFTLAPGQTSTRAMKVHAGEGDITTLVAPEGTKVVVRSDCGAP